MKTIIHVNQHKIKSNTKMGTNLPVLTVKTYKTNDYVRQARIIDQQGQEVARIVYRPDKPLSCGAKCWIETTLEVEEIECD